MAARHAAARQGRAVSRTVEFDFIPKSQKNKLRRTTYIQHGKKKNLLSYTTDLTEQRQKLEWLLKRLDMVDSTLRFSVGVRIYPKSKRTVVILTPEEELVGSVHGVADPDGVAVTILDSLKRSARVADDSINHVKSISVEVVLE